MSAAIEPMPHAVGRRRNINATLNNSEVAEILRARDTAPIMDLAREFAEKFEVHASTVWRILRGKAWAHIEPALERQQGSSKRRLSTDEIEHIRKLARTHSPAQVARMSGLQKSTVWRVVRRRTHAL